MMKDEFNYGMQSMDAQFQYKNEFANAPFARDLGMVATGEQDRLNMQHRVSKIDWVIHSRRTTTFD